MNGQTLEREIRGFLADTYGATNINVVPGGKHPKIMFDYAGKHWSRAFACSPSDENAAKAACRDLARMLGAPPIQHGKTHRTLDDITRELDRAPLLPLAAPPLRRLGRLSLRPGSRGGSVRLLVYVTDDSLERAKLVGTHLKLDYTSDGPVIRRADSGPTFRTNGTASLLEAAFQDIAFPLISPRLFRSSPIEVVAMDDQLGLIIDPAKFNYDAQEQTYFGAAGTLALRKLNGFPRLRVYFAADVARKAGFSDDTKLMFGATDRGVELVPAVRSGGITLDTTSDGRKTTNGVVKFELPWMGRLFSQSPVELEITEGRVHIVVDPAKFNYDEKQEEPVAARASKTFNRGSFDDLDAVRTRLGMSESEFSVALGYSAGAFSGFRGEGSAPAVALLAAEALERRCPQKGEPVVDRRYMITQTQAGAKFSMVELPADLEEMTLGGKRYLLLPAE